METTVEQLIKERSYASLTSEELVSVSELCETEEEFQHMKQFFQELDGVAASDKTIINPEVKQSLDSIFSAKFPGIHANWTAPETAEAPAAPVIPLHQRTWVRVAAVGMIVLATAPFWNLLETHEASQEKELQTARLETPQANGMQSEKESYKSGSEETSFKAASPGEAQQGVYYDSDATGMPAPVYYGNAMSDKAVPVSAEVIMGATAPMSAGAPTYAWAAGSDGEVLKTGSDHFVVGSKSLSFSSEGRLADLNPNGYAQGAVSASLAAQPDDLLDLLSPAF